MEHEMARSVKIMHTVNEITGDFATKYPIEYGYSNFNKLEENLLYYCLCNGYKYNKLMPKQIEVLEKLYDNFKFRKNRRFYKEKRAMSGEEKARIILAFWDPNRTHFNREEERIICLNAFRRLQYKTQVMINSASDDQRTRLLHSLEVEKAAKKMAIGIGANWELTSAIAVAHDIGHTPFGHAGERTIDKYLSGRYMGRFAHALQSVKVLDKISRHHTMEALGLEGVGLSDYVLEGVLKHDSDSFSDDVSSPAFRLQYDIPEIMCTVSDDVEATPNKIQIGSIESQIVLWADKIEYLGHDWEECNQFGLLDKMLGRINNIVIEMGKYKSAEIEKDDGVSEYSLIIKVFDLIMCSKCGVGGTPGWNSFFPIKNSDEWNEFYNTYLGELLLYLYKLCEHDNRKRNTTLETICNGNPRLLEIKEKYDGVSYKNTYYFSPKEYGCIFDFFNAANSWVNLTGTYPIRKGDDYDLLYIFFEYLNGITPHVIIPSLVELIVNDTLSKSNKKLNCKDRKELIELCNEEWDAVDKESANSIIKDKLRMCFFVRFTESHYDFIKTIFNFIENQYIFSTRVQNMNLKAAKIINTLLDFYCNNPNMLPYTFRSRIAREISYEMENRETEALIIAYFEDLLACAKPEYRESVKKTLCSEHQYTQNDVKLNDGIIKKFITTRIVVDYVSGMTDRMAELKYNEIVSSSTAWSTVYGE